VTADDLFAVFVALRSSIVYDHSIAQYEDPRFYTRQWLEYAIRSALAAAKEPDRPGLNWIQDSLLTNFGTTLAVQADYGYELVNSESTHAALLLRVVDECKRPSSYMMDFAFENGAWRVSHTKSVSTTAGKAWFHSGLTLVKEFPHIKLRDRSRYLNESILGKTMGLNVERQQCSP
jgi:hypothetical protein